MLLYLQLRATPLRREHLRTDGSLGGTGANDNLFFRSILRVLHSHATLADNTLVGSEDGLARQTNLAVLLCVGRGADYTVGVRVAHHHLSIRQLLLPLLLQCRVVLLLDVVLVPVEQFLNRVAPQQKEAFLNRFFALRHFVHARVREGRSWFCQVD